MRSCHFTARRPIYIYIQFFFFCGIHNLFISILEDLKVDYESKDLAGFFN